MTMPPDRKPSSAEEVVRVAPVGRCYRLYTDPDGRPMIDRTATIPCSDILQDADLTPTTGSTTR
jgi:hypothetical protein